MAAGFVGLMLMLGYWQVVAAPGLNDEPDNPQALQREREVDRGRILSADGKVLAGSRAVRVRGQRIYERVYPQGDLASQVIGYSSPEQGKTGVEASWNRWLAGSYGTEPLLQRLNLRAKRGANVETHLDTRVQEVAQTQLQGTTGAVVALSPETGGVIAMASSPTYDLSRVRTNFAQIAARPGAPLLNRATAGRYPPGSSFKVVTATAALESGLYSPGSRFDDNGRYVVNGQPIRNFGGRTFGGHTLADALENSINTTFARIGEALGARRLAATMTAYGFGERPPIDLPEDEVLPSGRYREGVLLALDEPGEDTARIAIGQERLQATPLQMAMVAAGVANDGTVMAPRVGVRALDRAGDVVRELSPEETGQPASPAVAAELTEMMEQVVESGTGTAAAIPGVRVAGKTGTAETGAQGRNEAWFIGFAPAEDPVVAVAVVVEDTTQTGGQVAAPIAGSVMEAALQVGAGSP
jgi:peptidoglycan glycosyltransferase